MTTLIFALIAVAMVLAWRGSRTGGLALFVVAAILAVVSFNHHVTSPLQLGLLRDQPQ